MTLTDILSVVFGSGGLGLFVGTYIMFYKEKKRKAAAEANSAEIHNEQTEVDRLEARINTRDDKIDAIYQDLRKEQREKQEILNEKNRIEIEYEILKIKKCDKRACKDRVPPSEF